jgi:methylase of polypeptide subunit release factors
MTKIESDIFWIEGNETHSAAWHSENNAPAPKRIQIADDTITADHAYKLACEGTALLWRGDFHNAKQLLQAMTRRVEHQKNRKNTKKVAIENTLQGDETVQAFHLHRKDQVRKTRILGMLLVCLEQDLSLLLRRAPSVNEACLEAYGPRNTQTVVSLRELLGVIGAHEWRKNGIEVRALGGKIHPHYGVFSPIRGEYLDLIAKAPLPSTELAFDIGTGSGVIAALLAKRGVKKVIATDLDQRALACAQQNIEILGLHAQIELRQQDLFPDGSAPLIVCNPPWIPAKPSSSIEYAVYDPDSQMLRNFLAGVGSHLPPDGEAWLIMSDLAEHLGLRSKDEFWQWIDCAGLHVIGKLDIRPRHSKASDKSDPLHQARAAEITSLWRLRNK